MNEDLHVHLHGCLYAQDLWEIGKDVYKSRKSWLDWYAKEYLNAWGRKPNYLNYWESSEGLALLEKDYYFLEQNPFHRFQACFNLIVALCPIHVRQFDLQKKIIVHMAQSGLRYFEARTLIPARFTKQESSQYLIGLCQCVQALNRELSMKTCLVFALDRGDEKLALFQYTLIREMMKQHKFIEDLIHGIDFHGQEEGYPPKEKRTFIARIHRDNLQSKPLKILYHVGESFTDTGMISAMLWIWELIQLKVDRIGHGIALGLDPENLRDHVVFESKTEYIDTLNWLMVNQTLFKSHGFDVSTKELEKQLNSLRSSSVELVEIVYDSSYIERCATLQRALAAIIKKLPMIFESCPSSNQRIGQVKQQSFHPLKFFHDHELKYVICSDDPGIFKTSLKKENLLALDILQSKN